MGSWLYLTYRNLSYTFQNPLFRPECGASAIVAERRPLPRPVLQRGVRSSICEQAARAAREHSGVSPSIRNDQSPSVERDQNLYSYSNGSLTG